ncbi:MAG TPA: pyridoxine 5'-phosphate synthase [Xanthomonadaceae bacterium]|jgi:pyridoxine 5-phosphate synthase|nr:pyridoxine 5'-phosphate synthase [Xanthomonadaceae bacterium]
MTLLSINLNKVAVLRQSRGGALPSPLAAARLCLAAGARGITVHPRPDRRHITAEDVDALAAHLPAGVEFNIEGNPFAPERAGYPGLLALAARARPAQVTFVPDADGQITSDHGFDPLSPPAGLAAQIAAFRALGCRVSLFVDPGTTALEPLRDAGAERIEIYTGPYASAFDAACGRDDTLLAAPLRPPAALECAERSRHAALDAALDACAASARAAQALGLGVNAGHDLSQHNLALFLARVPGVLEVSIGHALVAESLVDGLDATVRRYRAITGG